MRWAQPHRDWGGGTCPIATSKVGDTHTQRQDPRETGGWGGAAPSPIEMGPRPRPTARGETSPAPRHRGTEQDLPHRDGAGERPHRDRGESQPHRDRG